MTEAPIKNPRKAGFIPYFNDNGIIRMMFMVPSDPFYGGPDPQIAKGGINDGEIAISTAMREAREELGLRQSNLKFETLRVVGENVKPEPDRPYTLMTFAAEVENMTHFDIPHYETGEVRWMTLEEFDILGRPCHRKIVRQLVWDLITWGLTKSEAQISGQ
jgi:8-oxo-dGTP pyrophosphatase MutT (NUDIX family)